MLPELLRAVLKAALAIAGIGGLALVAIRVRAFPILAPELAFYFAFMAVLLRHAPIATALRALDRRRRWFVGGVFGLAIIGQIGGIPRITYPFVPWTMYSEGRPAATFVRYTAVRASGSADHFPFSRATPSADPRAVMAGVGRLVGGSPDDPTTDRERLDVRTARLTTLVTMNIFFWENIILLLVVLSAVHGIPGSGWTRSRSPSPVSLTRAGR